MDINCEFAKGAIEEGLKAASIYLNSKNKKEKTMDLKTLIDERFEVFAQSNKAVEYIDKALESAVKSAIDDMFSWEFRKKLKETLSKKLEIDLNKIDIQPFMQSVIGLINDIIVDKMNQDVIEATKTQLEAIMSDFKPEYKLSELIENLLSDDGDEEGEITLITTEGNYADVIYIDKEPNKTKYECQYKFKVRKSDNCVFCINITKADFEQRHWMKSNRDNLLEIALYNCDLKGSKIILDHGSEADNYRTTNEPDY